MNFLRPANVVSASVLAVLMVAAAGGGAVADRLITGRDIRDGSVTTRDVRNGTLTSADIRDGSIRPRDLDRAAVEVLLQEVSATTPTTSTSTSDPAVVEALTEDLRVLETGLLTGADRVRLLADSLPEVCQ